MKGCILWQTYGEICKQVAVCREQKDAELIAAMFADKDAKISK